MNPLRVFAVAVRHRTFTSAAQELDVTQVAVSRQISILEDYLGTKLFERGASSVKLTETGKIFGQQIAPLIEQIEIATQRLRGSNHETMLNVRVYPTFANYWLIRRLMGFRDAYPDYEINFDTKIEPLDFRGTYLDFAIQLGHGDWTSCGVRELFPEEIDLVCSPDYIEKIGGLNSLDDLHKVTLLHSHYRRREWDTWASSNNISLNTEKGFHFQTSTVAYQAAIQGMGAALGQLALLEDELKEGRLVQPFKTKVVTDAHFWVVWPTTRSTSVKAKRAIDWILKAADQSPQFFRK